MTTMRSYRNANSDLNHANDVNDASMSNITDGELPLTVAAAYNCVDIIQILLKSPNLDIGNTVFISVFVRKYYQQVIKVINIKKQNGLLNACSVRNKLNSKFNKKYI